MAAGTVPIFIDTPKGAPVNFATANTNRDGTGTIQGLYTAGADGGRVDKISFQAAGTTTAGANRLFKRVSAGTWRLHDEIIVPAVTPSTSVEAWNHVYEETIVLGANEELGVSTHNAESFNAHPDVAGDY